MKQSRNHSDAHPGVSVTSMAKGRHRIRWREVNPDGTKVPRSWTVYATPAEAEIWAIAVHEELMTTGCFTRPDDSTRAAQPMRTQVASLQDLLVAWASWRINVVGARGSTRKTIPGALVAFETAVRAVSDYADDTTIPVTVLTPETCERVIVWMRTTPTPSPKGRKRKDGSPAKPSKGNRKPPGPARINQIMRYIYMAWEWASDDAGRWPGLPTVPRVKSKIVPPPPVPSAPLLPPTWSEMDLVVQAARKLVRQESSDVGDILELARGTGLRVGQVTALQVRDFNGLDSPVPTLRIRPELGKSKREQQGRTIPLAPVLAPLVRRLAAGRAEAAPLFDRKKPINVYTLRTILKQATDRGLRPAVYRSDERGNNRITHFMRAGFQYELRRAGVAERTIDRLVGHNASTTRDRHYAPAEDTELIDAVRTVPAVVVAEPKTAKVYELTTARSSAVPSAS